MSERLHKVLAAAGLGSRRACEQMILDGRVRVNGRVVSRLPVLVEESDRIVADGRAVRREPKVYLLLNKPAGVVCTNYDPAGRVRAVDLAPGLRQRVYPVGRLDADSGGLLLLTNDGELANRLTHPRYEVPKTYEVMVDGWVKAEDIERLLAGVRLAEAPAGQSRRPSQASAETRQTYYKARAAQVRLIGRSGHLTRLAVTLKEGRNRQVRRMLAKLGFKVRRLRRVSMGNIHLRGLGVGRCRPLTVEELAYLRRLAGLVGATAGSGA